MHGMGNENLRGTVFISYHVLVSPSPIGIADQLVAGNGSRGEWKMSAASNQLALAAFF